MLLAGAALAAIYARNVFADFKVTRGTYPNNIGHTELVTPTPPDAFADSCHQAVAVDEAAPDILKTLELARTPND
jgi:hypothetical protein